MKLGELLRFRQGLNLNRENFSDTPDFYWSEPVLEGTTRAFARSICGSSSHCLRLGDFNSLSNALDMRARIRSVNDKITYAAEVSTDRSRYMKLADYRD